MPDLAARRLGGRALLANDEFFAPKECLVADEPPMYDPARYTDHGKWMDGWETRRRREPGEDWCIVGLGLAGDVRGVVIDTRHFRGNHPERAAVDACATASDPRDPGAAEALAWTRIVPEVPLEADALNVFPVETAGRWTHVRLVIVPDGGVARLRVHGVAIPEEGGGVSGTTDLASVDVGGAVLACSDAFFCAPGNLLLAGPPAGMHDGWETRRRRGPGHDWVVVHLGRRGILERVEVDTRFFKGNHPGSCDLEAHDAGPGGEAPGEARRRDRAVLVEPATWAPALADRPLGPDRVHVFEPPDLAELPATHVRLRIHPDGGVARLRVHGRPTAG
ncbi:MAG TPA: allantoicase [Gemmatimonadota bacterium]|nr:allantoicase [Gemmatimonadota bacterium]